MITIQRLVAGMRRRLDHAALRLQLALGWLKYGRRYPRRRAAGAPVLVSLTSYPPRFGTLHLTLRALLSQSLAPAGVILWIADADRAYLPARVTRLTRHGLQIRSCPDLHSYKKLIPLWQTAPDLPVVTADDDIYYRPDWLAALMAHYTPGRREVLCHRMHAMRVAADGTLLPYAQWELDSTRTAASTSHFPTGMGGVLYPPGIFAAEVLQIDAFRALCPRGDDIWFWWMARTNGATFRRVPGRQRLECWAGSQDCALWHDNLTGAFNDTQIAAMTTRYGAPPLDTPPLPSPMPDAAPDHTNHRHASGVLQR